MKWYNLDTDTGKKVKEQTIQKQEVFIVQCFSFRHLLV